MKICSIITSFTSGGAEILVTNMAAEFRKQGHSASVLALCDATVLGNSAATEGRMMERLRAAGAEPWALGLSAGRRLLPGARALRRALREIAPDIIHAHTARVIPMLRLAGVKVPVVLTHHNSRLSFPPQLFAAFDAVVSAYVAISRDCAATVARHASRPVELIHNGVEAHFRVARPRTAPSRNPVVLAVGTASAQKDYPTLIAAAGPLRRRLEAAGMVPVIRIVGGGEILPELQRLIDQRVLGRFVELLGERHDVADLLAGADLFANSSRWEGLPLAILEAKSAALPVVAAAVAGNRELVDDDVNGRLVPPGDPEALAEAMADLLLDPERYGRFSAASLARSADYTVEGCAAAHEALYERLTGAAANRRAA